MARLQKYRLRFALVVCISLLSVFILFPVQAEDTASVKVPVVLDGRELLEVGALGKLTAQERATFITSNLEFKSIQGIAGSDVNMLTDSQIQELEKSDKEVESRRRLETYACEVDDQRRGWKN